MYQLRILSHKIFSIWKNVQTKNFRKLHCSLSKINLHYQTVIYHRLTVFRQLFSWTSVGLSKCPINKMIGSQVYLNVWAVPSVIFSKWKNVQSRHCRKIHCALSKINLHYQTVIYHRLTVFRQLFRWTQTHQIKIPKKIYVPSAWKKLKKYWSKSLNHTRKI